MNKTEVISSLKLISLFQELGDLEIESIVCEFEEEQYPASSVIIREGDYGDKVYFILEGNVDVFIINKEGRDVTVATLHPGNYFGELAILIDGFRNNSVRAASPCKLLSLTKQKFSKIHANHELVAKALNKVLSRRLGETLHLMSEKKENIFILLIVSGESDSRVQHFEKYFRQLSSKPVAVQDGSISQEEFIKQRNEADNHYFLIKCSSPPTEFQLQNAHHIINFVATQNNQICLLESASNWQIEHTVRKITKKTVGIALCSGGAPGAAQLGVLKVLHAEGIPIDYIVGTSVGAVIGGSYAFGQPLEELTTQFIELSNQSALMSMATLLKNVSFKFSGVLKNTFYRKLFTSIYGNKTFSDAEIPFAAVASDLFSGKTVILKEGSVVDAIIASNTAPVLFEPFLYEEKLLIDGVATDPLPVDVLINEGIDIKIAVPIPQLDLAVSMTDKSKLISVFIRSRSMMAEQITNASTALADVVIKPNVEGINMNDWQNLERIIKAGEEAAHIAVKRIRYLLHGANVTP